MFKALNNHYNKTNEFEVIIRYLLGDKLRDCVDGVLTISIKIDLMTYYERIT